MPKFDLEKAAFQRNPQTYIKNYKSYIEIYIKTTFQGRALQRLHQKKSENQVTNSSKLQTSSL